MKPALALWRNRLHGHQQGRGTDSGFTLIELLITIVILGILATVVIFGVANFRGDAETATKEANCATFERAVAAYSVTNPQSTADSKTLPAWYKGLLDDGALQLSDGVKEEMVTSFNAWVDAGGNTYGMQTAADWDSMVAARPNGPIAINFAEAAYCGGSATPVVYYKNCTAARAAGVTPLHRGDPGYGSHLDRDNDGVACE